MLGIAELARLQEREADVCLDLEGIGRRLGDLELERMDLTAAASHARRERNGLRVLLKSYGVPTMGVDTEDDENG